MQGHVVISWTPLHNYSQGLISGLCSVQSWLYNGVCAGFLQCWVSLVLGFFIYILYRQLHVKGMRKKINVKILKIIQQFKFLGRFFNNFCNFWVFLAPNQKSPKITVLTKWKLKKTKIGKKLRVKIFALKIELYCKVKNLNFQISLNYLDK